MVTNFKYQKYQADVSEISIKAIIILLPFTISRKYEQEFPIFKTIKKKNEDFNP